MLLLPGGTSAVAAATGEPLANLREHRRLLAENGLRYLADRQLFLNNNTDGPRNPLSKVYSREEGRRLFADFSEVQTAVRFLHLRSYPGTRRIEQTQLAAAVGRRWGWHLWISARRPAAT